MNSPPTDQGPRDPFAMLLDPDRVVRDMQHSERLQRLQRRVCHPLDRPAVKHGGQAATASDFDRMVDESPEEPEQGQDAALDASAGQNLS